MVTKNLSECSYQLLRRLRNQGLLASDDGVHLDLDAPGGIEERGDDDHGGSGANVAEELAVDAAHGFPVFGMGEDTCGCGRRRRT